jgi:DNA-binding NarL/FixJ family response regulator
VNPRPGPVSRIRLILVDDHPVVREGLRTLLDEEADLELVGEARSTEEAVRLVVAKKADVVLMDLMMPGDDGIEGIRKVRAARPGTQIVVLTSFGDETRVRAALEAGAISYLLKDVLRDELVRAIRAAASGQPTLDPVAQRYLLNRVRRSEQKSSIDTLTPRELSILERIGKGWNNQAIAKDLGLTHGTVKGHVSRVLDKLGVEDRTQAALLAVKEGVVKSAESSPA